MRIPNRYKPAGVRRPPSLASVSAGIENARVPNLGVAVENHTEIDVLTY